MKQRTLRQPASQDGFTIVELMIATLVFSVILTIITMGVISFSNRYYKGVYASSTQNVARTIMDSTAQAIEFGSAAVTPTGSNSYFCAGGSVYMFNTSEGTFQNAGQTGVYVRPMTSDVCTGGVSMTNGQQLLSNHMRVTNLSVEKSTTVDNAYIVNVVVAYGDNDVLCVTSAAQGCSAGAHYSDGDFAGKSDVACRSGSGSQYCSVSKLTTTVQKRVVQ